MGSLLRGLLSCDGGAGLAVHLVLRESSSLTAAGRIHLLGAVGLTFFLVMALSSWYSSVQFSRSFLADSLQPYGLQHNRPSCPSPTPGVCSNSCPSIESVMPSNHLILCRPLLLLPSIFPSIRVFSNESVLHIRWPKYCSFSFSISPSNGYSGLISFRIDWLDFHVVQGSLKSLLQHCSFKSTNSLVLSFLYSPTLTSKHDYWKNHSFE